MVSTVVLPLQLCSYLSLLLDVGEELLIVVSVFLHSVLLNLFRVLPGEVGL